MAKKKKPAKKKATRKKPSRQRPAHVSSTPATGREGQAADLAEVVRENDVDPGGTTEVVVSARMLSDAQSGDGPPPPAPAPAPIDSPAELNVTAAGEALVAEVERWRERAEAAIRSGRADAVRGRRDSLWALEPAHFKDSPRASFVGRAIYDRSDGRNRKIGQTSLYVAIYQANRRLLPAAIQRAVETLENRVIEGANTAKENNKASGQVIRHVARRLLLLQLPHLHYVESRQGRSHLEFRLTPRGRRVFNEWPDWHKPDANPYAGDEPVPEEPAGGTATEPT
jgi:hypothetical protein